MVANPRVEFVPAGIYTLSANRQLIATKTFASNEGDGEVADKATSSLARAVLLLTHGDHDAALQAASEACHEEPELPEPHYAYGQAWAALGRHLEAERAFAAALQLAPAWADAWVNYGLARYRQAALDDAIAAMRQALRHMPDHAAAAANLGAFLRLAGDSDAGEDLLLKAIASTPENIAARLNLAADFLQDERSEEALALLSEGSPLSDHPAVRSYYLACALAYLQQSRPADARAALDACAALGPVPPDLAPLWHWRCLLLARAEGDEARARAEAEQAEASLSTMGADAVPENQIMAHYDLAKFWSGLGAHGRAFGLWRAAHKLLAQSQPFSRAAHHAFVDANITTFTRGRFEAGPKARNGDPAPVFIVGMPRSGTTLCEQILAAHAYVHGAGERPALERAMDQLAGSRTPEGVARLAAASEAELDAAANTYLTDLRALAPSKVRIIDKLPANYLNLALVALLMPGARIIHCTRDARDIGLSIFTFRFHGQHGYAHDLADLGWTIRQQDRLMTHWKTALPNPILTVALSDWIADFDGTLARVLAHLHLPPDPNCARFHEADSRVRTVSRTQVRQPINARGLGRWRHYERELAPLIEELDKADLVAKDEAARRSRDRTDLFILPVPDPARALGLAVNYLMAKLVFADQKFGAWSRILVGQIERGHYRFVADRAGHVCGFFGYARTDEASAEDWLAGRNTAKSAECRDGDHMIFNVWSADTVGINRFMLDAVRPIIQGMTMLYFQRFYPNGRTRPVRLAPTDFLRGHIDRAKARFGAGDA